MTKTIANRMKLVLPSLISRNQSAFVLGRLITDNMFVVFELLHSMRKRNNGKVDLMALKLYMSKAYNRAEWGFVYKAMMKMGFLQRWCSLILDCITITSFSFYFNGKVKGRVMPTRGLRQGYLVWPYLFLLCAETFSCLIDLAKEYHRLVGMRSSRGGPRVSHLFFVMIRLFFQRLVIARL